MTLGETDGIGLAMTTTTTTVGNREATVIFAVETTAVSRYVFIPENIVSGDWDAVRETNNGGLRYVYSGAYLNGTEINLYYDGNEAPALGRGFYQAVVTSDGYTLLASVAPILDYRYEREDIHYAGGAYAQGTGLARMQFADNAAVYDLRGNVVDGKADAITDLSEFLRDADTWYLAYTWNADGDIDVCYVIDPTIAIVDVSTTVDGLSVDGDATATATEPVQVYENDTIRLTSTAISALPTGTEVDVAYEATRNGVDFTEVAVSGTVAETTDNAKYIDVDVRDFFNDGAPLAYFNTVSITGLTYDVNITNANEYLTDTMYYNLTGSAVAVNDTSVVLSDVEVGSSLRVALYDEDYAGMTAELTYTNEGNSVTETITASNGGAFWVTSFVPGNDVTIGTLKADYTITLGMDDTTLPATNYNFVGTSLNDKLVLEDCDVGAVIAFQVQKSSDFESSQSGNLHFNIWNNNATNVATICSNETVTSSTNRTFTFDDVVPTANSFALRDISYYPETEAVAE